MNDNIIPYVPIAPRVKASNPKSELLCSQLFKLIDHFIAAQLSFNHDMSHGVISICPDHINDLVREFNSKNQSEHKSNEKEPDIEVFRSALDDLIYPKFNGVFEITSPIWNSEQVKVWQFQLNQIVRDNQMKDNSNAELLLDQALAALRIWRTSLEVSTGNPQVTYDTNDLVYKLLDIELKLEQVQQKGS